MCLYLVDWKRSKQLRKTPYRAGETEFKVCADLPNANFHKYTMQLNFYRILAERQTGRPVLCIILAVFHPRQNDFYFKQVPDCSVSSQAKRFLFQTRTWTSKRKKIRTYLCYLGLLSEEPGLAGTKPDASWVMGWPALESWLLDKTSLRLRAGALPLSSTLGVGSLKEVLQVSSD
eukprot:g51987.t1